MKVTFNCEECGKEHTKQWSKNMPGRPRFCCWDCKSNNQRRAKPVTKEWLYQKYVVEEKGCPEIAKLVNRDPKSVYNWLKDFGIETRKRGYSVAHLPKDGWTFRGKKHSKATKEKIRQARLKDGHVPYMKNGKHWLKGVTGPDHPSWKGGKTPLRQEVYASKEWKEAVKKVWKRDNATCQRCKKRHNTKTARGTFHIHHIQSFQYDLTRTRVYNLVLLCKECHLWVHSKENVNDEFIYNPTHKAKLPEWLT